MEPKIAGIGFNDLIKHSGRSFQIQTEVFGDDTITIKTTIMENGMVVDVISNTYKQAKPDEPMNTKNFVEQQHQKALLKIQGGKYC